MIIYIYLYLLDEEHWHDQNASYRSYNIENLFVLKNI